MKACNLCTTRVGKEMGQIAKLTDVTGLPDEAALLTSGNSIAAKGAGLIFCLLAKIVDRAVELLVLLPGRHAMRFHRTFRREEGAAGFMAECLALDVNRRMRPALDG